MKGRTKGSTTNMLDIGLKARLNNTRCQPKELMLNARITFQKIFNGAELCVNGDAEIAKASFLNLIGSEVSPI